MAGNKQKNRSHFILLNNGKIEKFTPPGSGGKRAPTLSQDREMHGTRLLNKLKQLEGTLSEAVKEQKKSGMDEGLGLQIEFESFPNVELAFESLAKEKSGIELRNVRECDNKTFATVFVPDGKLTIFEKKILTYLDKSKDTKKGPRNSNLLNAITEIRAATLQSLWTDTLDSMPASDNEQIWWEVWLPVKSNRQTVIENFRTVAASLGFRLTAGDLKFPERSVLLVYGSLGQMKSSVTILNNIAELRRAKETADFFDSIKPEEQSEWVEELITRLTIPSEEADVPYVCLLDTGVNNGHPLLKQALADTDQYTVEPGWGVDDKNGHGTGMAGVALFGDLGGALAISQPVTVVVVK